MPPSFDVCGTAGNRYVLAVGVNIQDLRLFEYEADGTQRWTLARDGEVAGTGLYVNHLAGRILVAYATKAGNDVDRTRIRVLALEP